MDIFTVLLDCHVPLGDAKCTQKSDENRSDATLSGLTTRSRYDFQG
jgi:hypothetical protein